MTALKHNPEKLAEYERKSKVVLWLLISTLVCAGLVFSAYLYEVLA